MSHVIRPDCSSQQTELHLKCSDRALLSQNRFFFFLYNFKESYIFNQTVSLANLLAKATAIKFSIPVGAGVKVRL